MENYYISYSLYFRDDIKIDKEINYHINNNPLIENVIIFQLKKENYASMKISLSSKTCENLTKEEILRSVEEFILEFLLKLSLDFSILFPFYKVEFISIGNKKEIFDIIECTDKIEIIHHLKESSFSDENINFIKYKEEYIKLIRILSLIESDSVVVFMTLYDWFLEWVSSNTKKKQVNVTNYFLKNFDLLDLRKFGLISRNNFFIQLTNNKKEDIFTHLRNDIGHSYERVKDININSLSNRARNLIFPLVYIMKDYLKNN